MEQYVDMKEENNLSGVFSFLSDFIEKNSVTSKSVINSETSSFLEAMKDVTQIDRSNMRIGRKNNIRNKNRYKKGKEKDRLEIVLDDGYSFNVTNLPEYMEGHEVNISPLVMERLRNGEFSIQKTLDLHGYERAIARELFEKFILEAIKSQLSCVKIIHGRGLKSPDAPVLKAELVRWIVKAINRKWVVAFASCKMCDGGPGATYILLKKKPVKKKMFLMC